MLFLGVSITFLFKFMQMKATEQDFLVVLFIMLCNVVLPFESVDKIVKFPHHLFK